MADAPAKKVVAPGMNIYTVLAIVAAVAFGVGIGFVMNYSKKLSGKENPFYVEPKTADQKSGSPSGN